MSTNTILDKPAELVKTGLAQENTSVLRKKTLRTQLLGESINLQELTKKMSLQFYCQQYKDAICVSLPKGNAFFFDYGVVVFWSVIESKREILLNLVKPFVCQSTLLEVSETIHYECHKNDEFKVRDDIVHIPDLDVHTLLSASHALAQSSKLEYFETIAQHTITSHSGLTDSLANTGKIPLSRKALSMERGKLFKTKSDILLHFNLLDTPEYFWQYPEHEALYAHMSTYLELKPRVQLLNLKLVTINELLDMLATEQHHKYAASLEWIIIILIAVDILVYFIGD